MTPRLADEAWVSAAWPEVALPMTPYLAACGWTVHGPGWFLAEGRRTLLWKGSVLGVAQPVGTLGLAQIMVLSPSGPELEGLEDIVSTLLDVAFASLGCRRCEWRLLARWGRARAVAARLGFREEACLPGACLDDDMVIAGLLAAERRSSWS